MVKATTIYGSYAFFLGVVIAVIMGIAGAATTLAADTIAAVAAVLVILGAIVGLLNISEKEVTPFLIAAIALGVVGITGAYFTAIPYIGTYLSGIVIYLAMFIAPAAVIVAIKEVWDFASKA